MCPLSAGVFLNRRWHILHSTGFKSFLQLLEVRGFGDFALVVFGLDVIAFDTDLVLQFDVALSTIAVDGADNVADNIDGIGGVDGGLVVDLVDSISAFIFCCCLNSKKMECNEIMEN